MVPNTNLDLSLKFFGSQLDELSALVIVLTMEAHRKIRRANRMKAALIILGVIATLKSIVDQIIGRSSLWSTASFVLITSTITIIAGLLATFGTDSKSIEVTLLATECESAKKDFQASLVRVAVAPYETRLVEITNQSTLLEAELGQFRQRAARLGVNVPLETASQMARIRDVDGAA